MVRPRLAFNVARAIERCRMIVQIDFVGRKHGKIARYWVEVVPS